ncbi:DUF6452 family protein [Flagellimonas aequoris]|uniref:Uncharacterized protein n=1 Tax=Flagellimonas aequoris TaxID=2306997 RepID=A0A418N9K8_9FLAO|nr:DUF6452 family protein [Allomuricauda aequoris]RIV72338.1 hypothetical protein D2U88_05350 [Allomuricauda aequoris]TXK04363.1 hypothetical protein FQ019_05310 [Allomuricauda aequoris]
MKKIIPILLILSLVIYVSSCEKDDICVDGDTPLLVIGFYDIDDTTASKDVPSLRIKEVILDSTINTITDRSNNLDSIGIPLRSDAMTTSFAFITNSADDADTGEETGNIDTLTFSYTTREAFLSRACGFVMNFDNLSVTLPASANNWIQDIKVVQESIENSNNVHVKIYY